MGKKEIKDKLIEKLSSVPKTEEDIVYILSRVRKLLEIDNRPEKYSILNFYCNLTLHARISNPPKVIIEKLKKTRGDDTREAAKEVSELFNSKNFHDQLYEFLEEHSIANFYPIKPGDLKELNSLLLNVWSNTPIRLEYIDAFNIVFEKMPDGTIILTGDPAE